ncbi:WD domain, Gbeta repeat domain containing protein [Balamuthia mandrillaris]
MEETQTKKKKCCPAAAAATTTTTRKNLHHLFLRNQRSPHRKTLYTRSCQDLLLPRLQPEQILYPASSSSSSSSSSALFHHNHNHNRNSPEARIDQRLEEELGCLFCLQWNQDGSLLATGGTEWIQIWRTHRSGGRGGQELGGGGGRLLHTLRHHSEIVTALCWCHSSPPASSSPSSLASSSSSPWDAFLEREEAEEKRGEGGEGGGGGGEDESKEEEEEEEEEGEVEGEQQRALMSGRNAFFTGSLDKTITLWDNFKPVVTYTEHNDWIRCLALTKTNETLLSGCVSSKIYGWDVAAGVPIFRIHDVSTSASDLNTINSLNFANLQPNVFISGARDGFLKIWDRRALNKSKPVLEVLSHEGKVNGALITEDDMCILTSGRDSTLRLWDIRALSHCRHRNASEEDGLLRQYKGHRCIGYNVSSCFINDERHIVTGSEDNSIYIYERESGALAARLTMPATVVHLVHAVPQQPLRLASSSIDSRAVITWSPEGLHRKVRREGLVLTISPPIEPTLRPSSPSPNHHNNEEGEEDANEDASSKATSMSAEDTFLANHHAAVEALMSKYGDHILQIFHQHNFTFSTNMEWPALVEQVGTDNASADLLSMINEMADDFARALDLYLFYQRHANATTATTEERSRRESSGGEESEDDEEEETSEVEEEEGESINTSLEAMLEALRMRQRRREEAFEQRQRERQMQQQKEKDKRKE